MVKMGFIGADVYKRQGQIILKKYSPIGELSIFAKEYAEALAQTTGPVSYTHLKLYGRTEQKDDGSGSRRIF